MANGTWRLARGRSNAQIPLAVVGVIAVLLILLGRAQPTLFDHARAYVSDRAAPVLSAVRLPVDAVGRWFSGAENVFALYQENVRLKEENAHLMEWQRTAQALDQRLKRYQLLLNVVPDPEVANITAHVIGRSSRPFLNTTILDAGKRNHVKPGEAVIDERGMIGRIFLAGDHTSWVILLTDLNSRIPVILQPGNIQAIMAGDNSGAPTLDISASGAQLKSGLHVATSGDGALLPAGLPVGTTYWDGTQFRVTLLADAGRSDDVRILDLKTRAEEPPAPTTGDLPVSAAGLAPLAPPPKSQNPTPAPSLRPALPAPVTIPPRPNAAPAPAPAAVPPDVDNQ
ncbi:MAG TPA: rod shape-determining protein MreC [Rhizomicrobium sp.]|jgi:rod shape-determining protein MreC